MKSNAIQYLAEILKKRYGFRWAFVSERWKLQEKEKINTIVRGRFVIQVVDNKVKYENKKRSRIGWVAPCKD